MASFNFKVPAWHGNPVPARVEPRRGPRAVSAGPDGQDGAAPSCHASSWELARGLEVQEAGMHEWQEAWAHRPVPVVGAALNARA